ncbi:MAG: tetratricopeptide repeat protein, partial [Proteobacteria bacterium]|nr:tetratricopeptide repeat protein [Pseudomonadota bacterium]
QTALATMRAELDEVIAPTNAIDEDTLDQLMALGYIGGDPTAEAGEIDPRDVIDIIPITWQARQLIGRAMFQQATQAISTLEARMPNTFGVDLLRAQLLRRQGRLGEAAQKYVDLYLRSPSSTVALQLAGIYAAQGMWDDAFEWYRDAHEHQPNSAEAMSGMVRAALSLGRKEEAREMADEFLIVYPDHAQIMLIRAEMSLLDERPDLALEDAQQALKETPFSPWTRVVVAQAMWQLGQSDKAIEHLQDALNLDPHNAEVRVRLTECLLDVKRNAEAVRIIAPLARLDKSPQFKELHQKAMAALNKELGRE